MADTTNAQIGNTVDLHFWDTSVSPDAYTELGEIRSINGIGITRPRVNSSTLDSTSEEYIPGLPDGKEASIVFTTGAANTIIDRLRGWGSSSSNVDYKLIINAPATETLYFSLASVAWELGSITPGGLIEITATGQITGDISATDPHA